MTRAKTIATTMMGRVLRLGACLLVVVGQLAPPRAAADERPTMADTSTEADVRDCLRRAVRAVCDEHLSTYLDCFTVRQRNRIRRQAAILFVSHAIDLDLVDSHLLSDDGARAELAVNYTVTLTDQTHAVISILTFSSEDGDWRISGETVLSNVPVRGDSSSGGSGPVFRFGGGCANGRCGL